MTKEFISKPGKVRYECVKIGESMVDTTVAYKVQYPRPFEKYNFVNIHCNDQIESFDEKGKEFDQYLSDSDCIGTFNFYNGRMYGMLIMNEEAEQKLLDVINFMGLNIELRHLTDDKEANERMMLTWGRGEQYIVY